MNITNTALFPLKLSSVTFAPDTTSISEKSGARVPKGSIVDSVRAIVSRGQSSKQRQRLNTHGEIQLFWAMKRNVSRWMVWWYSAIAAGFVLLAIDHLVIGDKAWLIGVRFVIAAGFGFLAWLEWNTRNRQR